MFRRRPLSSRVHGCLALEGCLKDKQVDWTLSGGDSAFFVSDVHLGEFASADADPSGFLRALCDRLPDCCTHLFILGDLFEFWAGDDRSPAARTAFAEALAAWRRRAVRPARVFLMHGNRDFLLGAAFLAQIQAELLSDPCVIEAFGSRLLLGHGDAWCTDDVDYQRFRCEVRDPAWQHRFLALAPEDRLARIHALRCASEAAKHHKAEAIMDVNPQAIEQAFHRSACERMIHGHTHRPGVHRHGSERIRWVLPDWDAASRRGGWLCIDAEGARAEGPFGDWADRAS